MTTQNAMPTTPYLLDDVWVEAIEEALERQSQDVPFAIPAEAIAVYDLMFGRECDPTNYYRTVAECELYLMSYMDGAKAWAAHVDEVNASLDSKPVEIDYEAELLELVEDALDREYWGRGQW